MTKDSKKKMGCLAKTLIWLVIIVVVLGVFVQFWLDNAIQWSVNKFGPKVLGVDTSVQRVYLSPAQGRVTLEGLHVGNPEGFNTDGIFDLSKVDVDLSMRSLFSDPIVVSHVVVDGMEVTYEQGLLRSNVGTLIDNLSGEKKPDDKEEPEEPEEKAEGEGRKLIIEKFSLANSKVRVAMTGMMGLGVPIPLPSMELEGIGAKSGGATGKDVALELLKDIGGLVTGTVTGVGGVVADGAKAVGGAVADGAGVAVDAVSDGAKALAGVFGFGGDDEEKEEAAAPEESATEVAEVAEAPEEAAEAATEAVEEVAEPAEEPAAVSDQVNAAADAVMDGAKAVGDAISDGASAVGDAVSDGAKAVSGALAGMLGLGGEKEEAAAPEEPAEQPEEVVKEAAEAVEEAVEPAEEPAAVSDEVSAAAAAVTDGAKAVGDAISDGASAVGDAVSDGAKAVSGALKGMLSFGADKAEEPAAE